MKTREQPLFLKVYGKPKPAKIWKTNETSMKNNEHQWTTNEKLLFLKVYGKPKPAKIWKTKEQSMNTNENQWKTIVFKCLWEA